MEMTNPVSRVQTLQCRGFSLPVEGRCLIMGVLNVTPDSFSDGGRFLNPASAIRHAEQMMEAGADLIDVGGESTRPGAVFVDEDEEISRIVPVLEALGRQTAIPLSIDTRKSAVAKVALDLGASIVNDTSGLLDDQHMVMTVRDSGAGVILMHRQGISATMQHHPFYHDVVQDVQSFLHERAIAAQEVGITADRIIVDPGIGFGKTKIHNLKLLANLSKILALGFPVLVGASRKAFLGELTGRGVDEREMGHAAVVATAIWQGVHMVRVHEVTVMRDVVRVAQALQKSIERPQHTDVSHSTHKD